MKSSDRPQASVTPAGSNARGQLADGSSLPKREGDRPRTTTTNPHNQINQQPDQPLSRTLVERIAKLPNVHLGPSQRAPLGTVGFYIEPSVARGPSSAFLLSTEFAHVHPEPDHSLHLTLPEPERSAAIHAGWAEPHPLAGYPTVSELTVMIYAPRDQAELDVVTTLVTASYKAALGH
ncbi:MAG: luciferase family protein [Bosea sp. (in: a-proteobacteria)]